MSVREKRVVVGGADFLSAISIAVAAPIIVPFVAGFIGWLSGWPGVVDILAACLAHGLIMAGCRFRLVADPGGSWLWRTWLGVPWSRRWFGRRAHVVAGAGWDWDELSIVPEAPRDGEDRFVVMETPFCARTWEDLEACAAAADREIARVVTLEATVDRPGAYRTPYPRA
jgi:hypothetical protein